MKKHIHNKKSLEPYWKKLRSHGTSAEAFLWKYLQQKKLEGRKFRRQHSILNFIVDFYCPEEKLIIELDGQYHMNSTAEERDAARTKKLEELGFRVVRFENRSVFENLDWVLEEIKNNFKPPRPSDTPP
ncbi:Very-short-patch-repair endonuclease [Salinimicrobium catena]|uniref:Very-short-patch-repair endonuclease n=1 Tax=Salinimicrobium catena TaxID=390640 RepID=A0A1H5HVW1_9FLAO|nr:endonuclease domain-containing protein [Salinimicrobium catena]SDK73272.1 Very-short-patch-repair endonuclease [Salinimicrobium catena]SEE32143.1 Very-short-patch-repair endonuclease [Salinimicrobium catena]